MKKILSWILIGTLLFHMTITNEFSMKRVNAGTLYDEESINEDTDDVKNSQENVTSKEDKIETDSEIISADTSIQDYVIEDDDDIALGNENQYEENSESKISDTDMTYDEALNILENDKIDVKFDITGKWENHYNATVTINNISDEVIEDWEVEFDFCDKIESIWNAKVMSAKNNKCVIRNAGWNQDIKAHESVSFGMTVSYTGEEIILPQFYKITKERTEVFSEYEVEFKEQSRWDNKVMGEITIYNKSKFLITDWKLELETNAKIVTIWNAKIAESGEGYVYINNEGYNSDIEANGTVTFGIIVEVEEELEISEYYLYDMKSVIDIEEKIKGELEEGEIQEKDDFDTEKEYVAYQTVKKKLSKSIKNDDSALKTDYAKPAKKPGKTKLKKKKHLKYTVKGIKYSKKAKAKALQSFAKFGDKVYVVQHKGADVKIAQCDFKKKNGKTTNVLKYNKEQVMTVKGGAHGQTLEMFKYKNKVYMLLAVNSRKGFSQSYAIVPFVNRKLDYEKKDKKICKRLTKVAYANQKKTYFGQVGRVDAALSSDGKTLCTWFATDTNKYKDKVDIGKIQIACFDFQTIMKYFENNPKKYSLSFQSMNKKWCYYSCEQNKESQQVRPGGSNQGIEVSNQYTVTENNKKVKKNKVYFSAGNEGKNKPLYIGMMTIWKKDTKDLTKNCSYRTQLRINPKGFKIKVKGKKVKMNMEMEGIHLQGDELTFVLSPYETKGVIPKKNKQYIMRISKDMLDEGNYSKR